MNRIKNYFIMFKSIVGNRIYLILLLGMLAALFEGIGVSFIFPILQKEGSISNFISSIFHYLNIPDTLLSLLILIISFFVLRTLFLVLSVAYHGKVTGDLLVKYRKRILELISKSDYRLFAGKDLGFVNNLLTTEMEKMSFSFKLFITILTVFFFAIVYLIISLILDAKLLFSVGVIVIPVVFIAKKINRIVRSLSLNLTSENGKFQGLLIQFLKGYKYFKSTNSFYNIFKNIYSKSNSIGNIIYRIRFFGGISEYGFVPLVVVFVAGIIYYSVSIKGKSIGSVIIFIFLIKQLSDKLIATQSSFRKLLNNAGSISVIQNFENELEKNLEKSGGVNVYNIERGVFFKNVYFSFNKNSKMVLKNVNFEFKKGNITGIVGELGSGKSTVFNLISGIFKPFKGNIFIDEVSYRDINIEGLREKISYVTQEDVIFNDTLYNNITLWDNYGVENIEKLLREIGIEGFVNSFPEGYNTILGENGLNVSGGQRQIIFFIREILKKREIILLDEFSSAMDSFMEKKLFNYLAKIKKERVVVLISHRLSNTKECDYIYFIKNSEIREEGKFDELIAKKGYFYTSVMNQKMK